MDKKKSLMPPNLLTNIDIIDYFKKEPRFNGVFSKNNLPKIKQGVYFINLDHNKNTGTHWVVIFVKINELVYFDNSGVKYIHKEV